jgi:hypothetical protein
MVREEEEEEEEEEEKVAMPSTYRVVSRASVVARENNLAQQTAKGMCTRELAGRAGRASRAGRAPRAGRAGRAVRAGVHSHQGVIPHIFRLKCVDHISDSFVDYGHLRHRATTGFEGDVGE